MQRLKRHKIKKEISEASTSFSKKQEEHDLTYYIHDRVELMHQVFSILKSKEIKMLAPECVRHISLDNLQELCTEELLGISSKRLRSILDGAEPPSDTESSSRSPSPQMETISLDSISSDEEILSQHSGKKKKHKHRRRNSKKKSKDVEENDADKSKASRAGLTVLELLELQARARAIRAQLQQEQALKRVSESAVQSGHNSSENEVEIKEEPAEVVEISSDEEKPKIEELEKEIHQSPKPMEQPLPKPIETQTKSLTKKVNDLVITVPQTKTTRKIKLNRNNKTAVSELKDAEKDKTCLDESSAKKLTVSIENPKAVEKVTTLAVEVQKKSKKKKKKKKTSKVEEVDNDEITLQLSDSEKMDLLESLEKRKVSSSEDSASSSDTESEKCENLLNSSFDKSSKSRNRSKGTEEKAEIANVMKNNNSTSIIPDTTRNNNVEVVKKIAPEMAASESGTDIGLFTVINKKCDDTRFKDDDLNVQAVTNVVQNKETEGNIQSSVAGNVEIVEKGNEMQIDVLEIATVDHIPLVSRENAKESDKSKDVVDCASIKEVVSLIEVSNKQAVNKELSEGEVTDRDSSEVEAIDVNPEVVCLSEGENEKKKNHKKEKKAKKEKKSKKEKKNKKVKSDFPEGVDQNFYKNDTSENNSGTNDQTTAQRIEIVEESIILDYDELEEILELSDDSSCYEVEGTALSKEPTAEEIEALSAKIDEIEREDVVTQEQIMEYERSFEEKEIAKNTENISWKDRYLDSKKVKTVLTTSKIFNAMRKKNKELRIKIDEANRAEESKRGEEVENVEKLKGEKNESLEEGSIEHYNTLQGSTKYVDPVKEVTKESKTAEGIERNGESVGEGKVTREMKRDAKQLLKMYKKLLKYNDMERKRDPTRKKKKKHKSKNRDGDVSENQGKNIIKE